MNYFAESFAWCAAQVTLFTVVASCLYGAARRLQGHANAALLGASLAIVGLLTLMSISPWPRWIPPTVGPEPPATENMARTESRDMAALSSSVADELPDVANESPRARNDFRISADQFAPTAIASDATPPWSWWHTLVAAAWMASLIGVVRLLVGLYCLARDIRASTPIEDQPLQAMLSELRQRCGIARNVRLRESASLGVAATAGWPRPVILLPPAWRQWTPDERRAVLLHELAHIKQNHFPAWLLSQLPVVAHYYHPAVHWLARRLRFEQEVAADRLAARLFGNHKRYASVLAGLALGAPLPRGPFTSVGLFMSRPFLMRRIVMLRQTTEPTRRSAGWSRALVIVLIASAAAVAGLRSPRAADAEEATNDAPPPTSTSPPAIPGISLAETVPIDASEHRNSNTAAVALVLVSPQPNAITRQNQPIENDHAWQLFSKTQLAWFKSHFVLQKALRDPQIAKLRLVQSASDPIRLLHDRIDTGFYNGSAVLYVRMECKPNECDDAAKLVDAVVDAYMTEVVYSERQKQLMTRDLLARSLKKLNEELSRKMQDYYDIARESGAGESGSGQVMREIEMKRLDRIEAELLRLENDHLELETSGRSGNTKFYAQRIAELSNRRDELEKKILDRVENSVDLTTRQRELDQLQRFADDMSTKLELMDIEANAPPQIQVIQKAVVTGGGNAPRTNRP